MNSKITDIQGVLYLIKRHSWMMALLCGLSVAASCGKKASPNSTPKEDTRAKKLLQGIWLNEDDEDVAFRVKGDTIYYPDSTSQPIYFCIYGDTLVMKGARDVKYPILKQAAHLFEFKSPSGDVIKLTKTSDKTYLKSFQQEKTVALNQNKLIKRDTIVSHGENRYHLYVQVNPTTYKVFKSSMNDDGVQVDNVYFDNIINLNVFHGANKLFSHDFKKKDFGKKVPDSFLEQAVLSDLLFEGIDEKGIHYLAVLAMPDSSLSYQVKIVVSYQGKLEILSV